MTITDTPEPVLPELDVRRRRAIEALRVGVPSHYAVAELGSGQTAIEDRFTTMLDTDQTAGMLIGGGFGSGKSHLLEHLSKLALDRTFAVSRVVISKETPLHDPVKVFRAAADVAIAPGRSGPAIAEAAAELDLEGRPYAELLRWTTSAASGLNPRFAYSLSLFAHARDRDGALAEAIVRFWSGDPLSIPDVRRRLKELGETRVDLPSVSTMELGIQRLRFATKLIAAAGCAGWVILLDEVELIGRYSILQRAKAYGEVARWLRGDHGADRLPLAAVLAMTDDFEAAVLSGKDDRTNVPAKLRGKSTPEADELASRAELGMRLIDRDMVLLTPPDTEELDRAYASLKRLHGEAYGWEPPDVAGLERLGATRMRQFVRAWINEWDLVRLDPSFRPETEVLTVAPDYREDDDLAQ